MSLTNLKGKILLFSLLFINLNLFPQSEISKKNKFYKLSGTIKEDISGESVVNAGVFSINLNKSYSSNAYGYYSLLLEFGNNVIVFSHNGHLRDTLNIFVNNDTIVNIFLISNSLFTNYAKVKSKTQGSRLKDNINSTDMGKVNLSINMLKKVPTIGGETDIIKALQLTPGIKRGGEGQIGMYVRGGGNDENLIVLDEATVYNAGHLLGFFSVFNSNSLKDVTMYKAGFPAQYGGRLSSVMDVRMKEGNLTKNEFEGSVGLIASNFTFQGPIKKNKSSFIVSARRTYIDKFLSVFKINMPYYFYDFNIKLNQQINKNNKLYFSSYIGDDVLKYKTKTSSEKKDSSGATIVSVDNLKTNLRLGNTTATFRWNHIFSDPRLFSNLSIIHTRFRYDINGSFFGNSVLINSSIKDYGAKMDFQFNKTQKRLIKFGASFIHHIFKPNLISTDGQISEFLKSNPVKAIYNEEFAAYYNEEYDVSNKIKLNYGARYSITAAKNMFYNGVEPRFMSRFTTSNNGAIKFSYARMKQYMHLVSSSSVALPTDLWYPVTQKIGPGKSDQISLGYYHSLFKKGLAFSSEVFYKKLYNVIEYKEGAVLLLNDKYEDELIKGKGTAYGIEFFVNKNVGKLTGWVGYSLSYATRQFDSLNNGKQYFMKYDRRHDVSIVAMYDFTKRISLSTAFVFSSGSPFTPRVAQYGFVNPSFTNISFLPVYADKNSVRLSSSHRLDFDFVVKNKPSRKIKSEWHFSVYNTYNRVQPSRVDLVPNGKGGFKYIQKGIFGAIFAIAYNFKF